MPIKQKVYKHMNSLSQVSTHILMFFVLAALNSVLLGQSTIYDVPDVNPATKNEPGPMYITNRINDNWVISGTKNTSIGAVAQTWTHGFELPVGSNNSSIAYDTTLPALRPQ